MNVSMLFYLQPTKYLVKVLFYCLAFENKDRDKGKWEKGPEDNEKVQTKKNSSDYSLAVVSDFPLFVE